MSGYGLWKKEIPGYLGDPDINTPHHYPLHRITEPSPAVGGRRASREECRSLVDNRNNCVSGRWAREDRRNEPAGDGLQGDVW